MTKIRRAAHGTPVLTRLAGLGVATVGLLALAGWTFDVPVLLRGRAALPPIAYQTSVAFVLLGASLLLARRFRDVPTMLLALVAAAIGLIGVVGHVAGHPLALEAALMPDGYAQMRQMSAATAIAVVVSGAGILALILARGRAAVDYLASLGGSGVMLLGAFGLVGQLALFRLWQDAAFAWMSIPSAVGCVLLGLGILGLPGLVAGRSMNHFQRSVPIAVTLATAIATVFLWQAIERHERMQFEGSLQDHASHVASDVRGELREQKATLVRMARRLETQDPPDRATFDLESSLLLNDLMALEAVMWVERPGGEHWVAVRQDSAHAPSAPLPAALLEMLQTVQGRGEELFTRRITLSGQDGVAVAVPMAGSEARGFLVGVFRIPDVFEDVISRVVAGRFAISIHDESGMLFEGGVPRSRSAARFYREAPVAVRGADWRVRISPTTSLWEAHDTALPETVLWGGLMMSVLLGLSMHLFGLARRRALGAEQANAELAEENAERRRVEDALRRRESELEALARQLARSNEDLERFAAVVAHDLKEPLVTVGMFAEEVSRELGETAHPEVSEYLSRILAATERMRRLIESVLALSRITIRGQPFAPVDLSTVMASVAGDLQARLEATGGTLETEVLPIVDGDAHQLQQLFQNLVGNALKFSRPGVPPRVRVRWEPAGDGPVSEGGGERCRIVVIDNGIGFSAEAAGGIFGEFQRLPEAVDYEGHGLGLAIVRRIVERHGGTIRARPGEGGGAVVEVDLPNRAAVQSRATVRSRAAVRGHGGIPTEPPGPPPVGAVGVQD